MTSRVDLLSTNTIIAIHSVFAKESIGMNHTSVDGNQNAMTEKVRLLINFLYGFLETAFRDKILPFI